MRYCQIFIFLSKIFEKISVVYPSKNKILKNNLLDKVLEDCKNINLIPTNLNDGVLGKIFLSSNRLNIFEFFSKTKLKKKIC